MAAPRDKTLHDLDGQWRFVSAQCRYTLEEYHGRLTAVIQNHALSDDVSAAMAVQGVNLFVRTALSRAPITLYITQTRDFSTGVETLSTRQTSIGRTMEEQRALDWEETASSHVVFGNVKTRARFNAVEEIANVLLQGGWEENTEELIEVQSEGSGWTSWQAWGFEIIDGKRHHVRRALLQKGVQFEEVSDEHVMVRMVYDWAGSETS